MTDQFNYLGGDTLHTGMYVALIQRLEHEGLTVNLVSRLKLTLNPAAGWAVWRGRHRIGPNPIADVRAQIRGRVHMVPVWSPLPMLSTGGLDRVLGGCRPERPRVLHTRQIVMARLALALRRRCPSVRVIAELEGDNVAETRYEFAQLSDPTWLQRARFWLEQRFWLRYEGRVLRESDAVVCVSHKLKDRMAGRYGLTSTEAARIHVFPSVASRKRFVFDPGRRAHQRRALGLDGRFIVAYNGNLLGRWQVPDKLVEVFRIIHAERPDAMFLVLTPEDHWRFIRPHLEAAGLPPDSFMLRSCPHGEVADHLCAADVGLLLRDRHPMNEVAAPGKFAEYVLCGLPIIMTDGIGDFSEQAKGHPCACVLADLEDLNAAAPALHAFCRADVTAQQRADFSRWGAERFAIELYVPRLAALYRELAHEALPPA